MTLIADLVSQGLAGSSDEERQAIATITAAINLAG
ncbi:MAG: hypothetical protein ACI9W1_000313 [Candidatus Azotimanducaceae bacterium]|jgi:hypothetical protein